MTNTMEETLASAKAHFLATYKRLLVEALRDEIDSQGDLSRVWDGDSMSGWFLGDIDEAAYAETVGEYAWRLGGSSREIREALASPDILESVDYPALVAEVEERDED